MKSADLFRLKVDLLTKGVKGNLKLLREGGGGPTGGVSFKVDYCVVNAPYTQNFAKLSPYEIVEVDSKHRLFKNNKFVTDVFVPKEPEYYKFYVDGIEMRKIVALDGIDTLVTSVLRYCSHKRKCTFCSLEYGKDVVKEKKPEQIAEVVKVAVREDKNRHLVLTTGTPPTPDKGALLIAEVIKAVKEHTNIPIQVQIEPPERLNFIDILYNAGADVISLNVETFDLRIRSKVVPEKPSIEEYLKAWRHSTNLFEESNVNTWLLVGLGETFESLIDGCSMLCEIGVIPFVVPYRPPPNVNQKMCNSKYLMNVYAKVAEIMKDCGIKPKSKAGCIRCGGCSAINVAFKINEIDNFQTEDL
ncbi:hypothetical protein DRO97_04835 [Archaeoglobales archaeon]|nr:MAG: hypothetical protein DRO97_04835 [Archaeoglobales archaeon]